MKEIIFRKLVDFFEFKKINYVVLGNINSYPNSIGSDVDIAVDKQTFMQIEKIVNQFAEQEDYGICNVLQHEIEGKYFVVSAFDVENDCYTMLALDICADYMRQGRVILNINDLLYQSKLIQQNEISYSICADEMAFLYYFIKKIEKGAITEEQFAYLHRLWISGKAKVLPLLNSIFKRESVDLIYSIFDSQELSRLSDDVLKDLNCQTNHVYKRGIKNTFLEFIKAINRFFKPTGIIISFLGCDGSGKSTVINELQNNSPEFEAFRGTEYHHLYATQGKSIGVAPVTNPHDQKSRSIFMSNLKLIYFLFKYIYSYWFIAYPQKVRSKLVIFDRYYHDILVDPKRYRHNGSKWLTDIIGSLIPKPDLFFIIDAPAEVLQQRKQEVSLEESRRQREAYINLKTTLIKAHVIDNTQSAESASKIIKKEIHSYLFNRYKKRYY